MTQQRTSATSPTHLVFVMAVYCMEPGWWFRTSYVVKCSIFCTNAISASKRWSSWQGQPFTGRTSIPTFSIYAGNVRLAPGISPNRQTAVHPWMLPEKPWSLLHIDHAINFLGCNWLVVTDAYTKYPCIHATQSVSAKSTIKLMQEDFGFPHTSMLCPILWTTTRSRS